MRGFTNEEAQYARKVIGEALTTKDDKVRVKSMATEGDSSHWALLPVQILRQMVSAIRGENEDKPLPHDFMGGRVVMAARIPEWPWAATHQALIVREYEEDGVTLWSVHYLTAQHTTDRWEGDQGAYDIPTREKAFDEFTERMYQRGRLSRDR